VGALLAATARILDVHDSGHEPGSAPVVALREERAGRQDGLWVSIAIDLLKHLAEDEFNQTANRMAEAGKKNPQVIEIPCDLDFIHSSKRKHTGGHRRVYYTPDQARKILLKQGAKEKTDLLEDAITLFDREMDTNPWREDLAAVEIQIDQAGQEINRIQWDEIPRLQRKENALQS